MREGVNSHRPPDALVHSRPASRNNRARRKKWVNRCRLFKPIRPVQPDNASVRNRSVPSTASFNNLYALTTIWEPLLRSLYSIWPVMVLKQTWGWHDSLQPSHLSQQKDRRLWERDGQMRGVGPLMKAMATETQRNGSGRVGNVTPGHTSNAAGREL